MTEEWTACCRGKGCPQVTIDSDFIYIKDDHGGQIKITASEFSSVTKAVRIMVTNLLRQATAKDSDHGQKVLQNLFGKELQKNASE